MRVTAALSRQTFATITDGARAMYPPDGLPEGVYARVGVHLADGAREDPATAKLIEEAVSALDAGRPFGRRSADEQLAALQA